MWLRRRKVVQAVIICERHETSKGSMEVAVRPTSATSPSALWSSFGSFYLQDTCITSHFWDPLLVISFLLLSHLYRLRKHIFLLLTFIFQNPLTFSLTCVNQNGERFYEPPFCLASWIYFYFKDSFSPLFSISLCVGDVFSSHITERPLRLKAFRVSSCLMQGIFNWRAFALVPGRRNLDLEPDCLGLSPGSTPSWALCALVSSSGKWRYYNTHLLEETPGLFMATVTQ